MLTIYRYVAEQLGPYRAKLLRCERGHEAIFSPDTLCMIVQ